MCGRPAAEDSLTQADLLIRPTRGSNGPELLRRLDAQPDVTGEVVDEKGNGREHDEGADRDRCRRDSAPTEPVGPFPAAPAEGEACAGNHQRHS